MKRINFRDGIFIMIFLSFFLLTCSGGGGGGSDSSETTTPTTTPTSNAASISLPASKASPLTPMRITTTGFSSGTSVTVTFSDSTGYSVQMNGVVNSDGTVLIGIPLYVNPTTRKITAGNVNVEVSQGSQGPHSEPAAFTIDSLPDLTGIPLGQISRKMLVASALLTQERISGLEYLELASSGVIDTSTERAAEENILKLTITAINNIDSIINDPTLVINCGTTQDGTPLTFTAESLAIMDSIMAIWLSEFPSAPTQLSSLRKALSKWLPVRKAINVESIDELAGTLATYGGLLSSTKTLADNQSTATDNIFAIASGVDSSLSLFDIPEKIGEENAQVIGLSVSTASLWKTTYDSVGNIFKVATDSVTGNATIEDVNKLELKTAGKMFSGFLATGASIISATVGPGGTGFMQLAASIIDKLSDGNDEKVYQSIHDNFSSLRNGGFMITIPAVINATQSGLDLVRLGITPYENAPHKITGLTDVNGFYTTPIPTNPSGNRASSLTIEAYDPTTNASYGNNVVDLSSFSADNTFTISPIGYSDTPLPSCTYTYDDWSACKSNGEQTRTVASSSPVGCTGTPVTTQACTFTPCDALSCYDKCMSAWTACNDNCPLNNDCINGCFATFQKCPTNTNMSTCECYL